MLQLIRNYYLKPIAWCLLVVFYLQLVAPVYAGRFEPHAYINLDHHSFHPHANSSLFNKPVSASGINAEVEDNIPVMVHPGSRLLRLNNEAAVKPAIAIPDSAGPGPSQPEMQSFKSVGADNMVDLFSGDFSYNIPLLDVGGYPVGIHYKSGITMDQEASWVGLGWNINPGEINRSVRGLPDDFDGTDSITKIQNIKINKTIGGSITKQYEFMAQGPNLGVKAGIFFNSYKGYGIEYGISPTMGVSIFSMGSLTAGLSVNNNSQTGVDISPSIDVSLHTKSGIIDGVGTKVSSNYNSRTGISGLQMNLHSEYNVSGFEKQQGQFPMASMSFAKPAFNPAINMSYTSENSFFSLKPGKYGKFKLTANVTLAGYVSKNYIAPEDRKKVLHAYGYLYYQKANGAGENVLMDFNRDKDVPYRATTPHIAVPSYTYDMYSINGEGIGGSFRPYRSDVGFVFDHTNRTKSKSLNLSLEVGGFDYAQIGTDLEKTDNQTTSGAWRTGNNLIAENIKYKPEDNTVAEPVYFKNPGEKVKVDNNYLQSLGDTNLVNIRLTGISSNNSSDPVLNSALNVYQNQQLKGLIPVTPNTYRTIRDKRTQVISYLNASLASQYALDTLIRAYDLNAVPTLGCNTNYYTIRRNEGYRKANHISEVTVLNTDGRRYIYGVPAYNTTQQEVSFSVNKDNGDVNTGLVTYNASLNTAGENIGDNSVNNNISKTDNFYSKEITSGYAHSFLLSGILSSDYVDLTGNGISEDDQGDAIRFNYSRVYGGGNGFYRWRAPYVENAASYGEGLKSDRRDDRGSYTYGEKEIWYLNSLESKNMIATFVLETDPAKIRKDVYGAKGENGGRDANQRMYQLKEINLYTKADLIKYGVANAKPIKTVHFEYDYTLCKDHPGASATGIGKLTLRKIWFTYNGNDKGVQNPYVFHYDKDVIDVNGNVTANTSAAYNNKSYDRWGNYKDASANLSSLPNADYPYASQSQAVADDNAAAWSLNEIILPSGARMKATYESDNYAYVQDKRAMQMMEVAGFGSTNTTTPQNLLYHFTVPGITTANDCNYIFIKVPDAVSTKKELFRKYLEGVSKVFVKFRLKVPGDAWGSGSDFVPCYVDIEDYGIKGNPSDKIIWIKPKDVDGKNAFLLAATQFLRTNLYSKAYPYSEPGDDFSVKQFLGVLASFSTNYFNAVLGFYNFTLRAGRCKEVISAQSFVRLNNPFYKKLGGGHRVKKVEIYDNFNKMTGQQESVYGQEYDYTTTIRDENGAVQTISSGVASYEPMVGREENPFTIPSDPYKEQVGLLAPADYFYVDEPLMESFYPAAFVGYSKVRVRSINKNVKSSNGVSETEFYTYKDFPVRSGYTPLKEGESKYSYQNPKAKTLSFFNFHSKTYISLTQGFKVELNDMNGKTKRTASYAENDLVNPINYTINYYRLENNVLSNRLSNKVDVVDSANGIITKNAEMGKEVELMVDLRQQLSVSRNSTRQLNLLIQKITAPPGFLPIPIPIPYNKSEINRYRSAAVTKVINQYGILDSVIVVDKGSKVTTRNLVFDSETGEPVLTQTNNEFDDPIYNFNYPAHWAYSGMSSAYKNIQKTFTGQNITAGMLRNRALEPLFESGDEIVLTERNPVKNLLGGIVTGFYKTTSRKIWAIDASKGLERNTGMFFIDANGKPVNTPLNELSDMMIIRSGKRNMLSAGVGTVMSMSDPRQTVGADYRFVFDVNSRAIAASAGRYKDLWRVDSTSSLVDSCYKILDTITVVLPLVKSLLTKQFFTKGGNMDRPSVYQPTNIETQMQQIMRSAPNRKDKNALFTRTVMDFDTRQIPAGATVITAGLKLSALPFRDTTYGLKSPATWIYVNGTDPKGNGNTFAHYNLGGGDRSNSYMLKRVTSQWQSTTPHGNIIASPANNSSSVSIAKITASESCYEDDVNSKELRPLIQSMVDNRNTTYGMVMEISNTDINGGDQRNDERRSRSYYSGFNGNLSTNNNCYTVNPAMPKLTVTYSYLQDTCVLSCKPSIRSDIVNPYKFGVLGNWRMDRAYTYYDDRKESNATDETNIRRDGEIKNFLPYWAFSTVNLKNASADTTVRWVWNSELQKFNRKGMEIENRDPLNRYNSAQYGYNKQLPVAVAQNSKNRNMVFDGFEDYDYKTSYCEAECPSSRCFPAGYPVKLNSCDTLANALDSFTLIYNTPSVAILRDANGCDTSTWNFPLSPVGPGKTYSFQSMFSAGRLSYPDSNQTNKIFQVQYRRPVCVATIGASYEMNFKLLGVSGTAAQGLAFYVPLTNSSGATIGIGQSPVSGYVTIGTSATITRSDLQYEFTKNYNTLKILYTSVDTIELYINNNLLGKVGVGTGGGAMVRPIQPPTMQFNQMQAKVEWIKFYDGNGVVAFDEQFSGGCATFALPKPEFDCGAPKPECGMAFTNYFNNRFKTQLTYAQIGSLYAQCGVTTSPCGGTMPTCNNIDTTYKVTGFDRFADFTKAGGSINTEEKHTGKFSIKVGANKTAGNVVQIVTDAQDAATASISIPVDYIPATNTVMAKGKGLLTTYNVYMASPQYNINACMGTVINSTINNPVTEYGNIDKDWGYGSPKQFNPAQYCATDYFGVVYNGKIQANYTANYVFRLQKGGDDRAFLFVNNVPRPFYFSNGEWKTDSIALQSCALTSIRLVYAESTQDAKCRLLWANPFAPEATVIPVKNLYPPNVTTADTLGTCMANPQRSILYPVQPANISNPLFSPIAGTQMVVGAWVKESLSCYTGSYVQSGIDISFGNSSIFYKLRPAGNIIEGWQRIEGLITIPAGATSMNIGLRSLGGNTVYFDDIRMHPFNATLKSYVYNSSNLRLMAELDENNYSSFYEYDNDGTLIRIKKETERGIKTIQETRSSLFRQ